MSRQAQHMLMRAAARNQAQQTLPANFRGYAQAAAVQDTKPPVALFGLDGTYASALVRNCQVSCCDKILTA